MWNLSQCYSKVLDCTLRQNVCKLYSNLMSAESNKNSGLGFDMSLLSFIFLGVQCSGRFSQTAEKPRTLEYEGQDRFRGLSIWVGSLGEGECRRRNPSVLL